MNSPAPICANVRSSASPEAWSNVARLQIIFDPIFALTKLTSPSDEKLSRRKTSAPTESALQLSAQPEGFLKLPPAQLSWPKIAARVRSTSPLAEKPL